jgi:putative SOS response-associated peptidase YedK
VPIATAPMKVERAIPGWGSGPDFHCDGRWVDFVSQARSLRLQGSHRGFPDPGVSRKLRRMCGRYASFLPPDLIARLFSTKNPLPNLKPTWNMAPTMDAPVVRRHPETGERHLDALTWGFVPAFSTSLKAARRPVNARSETVAASGMFRNAFAKRRCIVPAAAFYEWQAGPAGKTPYAIARADGDPLAFAGIWEGWRAPDGNILRSFAILTTAANAQMAVLHERMPVILEPADWPAWLGETDGDPASLLRPSTEGTLRLWQVDKRVGNVRNDGPDLLEPSEQFHPDPDRGAMSG